MPPPSDISYRFFSKVNKNGPTPPFYTGLTTPCWEWIAGKLKAGYGRFRFDGRTRLAHRVSWLLTHGVWPSDCCLHRCDNQGCVNPAHLFDGNRQDNMDDKVKKGRHRSPRGEMHGGARLTAAEVIEIRAKYGHGGIFQRELASAYKVSQQHVGEIVNRKKWAGI